MDKDTRLLSEAYRNLHKEETGTAQYLDIADETFWFVVHPYSKDSTLNDVVFACKWDMMFRMVKGGFEAREIVNCYIGPEAEEKAKQEAEHVLAHYLSQSPAERDDPVPDEDEEAEDRYEFDSTHGRGRNL